MPDSHITMTRSPDLDDAEVSRRLAMVYDLILQCGQKKRTADDGEAIGQQAPRPVAGEARSEEQSAEGIP